MAKKPKTDIAHLGLLNAMLDRVASQRFTDSLRADEFWGVLLRLGDIYTTLGEPFVTIDPTTHALSLNLPPYSGRQDQHEPRSKESPLAMNPSSFIQDRENAEAGTRRMVEVWEKAGIPPKDVWESLNKITPGKKRFFAQLAPAHARIVSTIEAQRETCYQIMRRVRDDQLAVLPREVRIHIATTMLGAVVTCTKALDKLAKAGNLIKAAKRQFVDVRNRARSDAERRLVQLREQNIKERPADRARRVAELLTAWDPEIKWKPSSIRAGRVYGKH